MSKGYTLIELILVVSLVMMLTGWASFFMGRFVVQSSVENMTDSVVSTLRKAQLYSQISRKGSGSGWGVTVANGNLVLFQGASYAGRVTTWDETIKVPEGITVAPFEVDFTRVAGVPTAEVTVNISGNNKIQQISVNSQGVIERL